MGGTQGSANLWERWGALAGFILVIAIVIEFVVSVAAGAPRNDSPLALGRFLHRHHTALELIWYVRLLANATAFLWLMTLVSTFRRSAGGWGVTLLVLLVGGTLAVALHMTAEATKAVALFYTLDKTILGVTYALYALSSVLVNLGEISFGVALLAVALLIFRTDDFPRRLGWLALAAGVIDVIGNTLAVPLPWFGVVGAVGLLGSLFVVVDTSDVLFRGRHTLRTEHADRNERA